MFQFRVDILREKTMDVKLMYTADKNAIEIQLTSPDFKSIQ